LTNVARYATMRDMAHNNELDWLVSEAGSVAKLAQILGLNRTHLHRQIAKGYLSAASALAARDAFPRVDVASLIARPNPEERALG
jgi:hypothetical protein